MNDLTLNEVNGTDKEYAKYVYLLLTEHLPFMAILESPFNPYPQGASLVGYTLKFSSPSWLCWRDSSPVEKDGVIGGVIFERMSISVSSASFCTLAIFIHVLTLQRLE